MSQKYKQALKDVTLHAIEHIVLDRICFQRDSWDMCCGRIFRAIGNNGLISREEVYEALGRCVRANGRDALQQHAFKNRPVHMTRSPEALAYTIHVGDIPKKELKQIKFSNSLSFETFMERYFHKEICDMLFEQLFDKTSPFKGCVEDC